MAGLGWQELVIVLVIIMIIFGAGKLPEIAKSLGQGVKEFKQEAAAPVGPTSASSTASATATGADANGPVAADTVVETDETVRVEEFRPSSTTRDAI
jgi:TatA/E family protein of Tat protein translocase